MTLETVENDWWQLHYFQQFFKKKGVFFFEEGLRDARFPAFLKVTRTFKKVSKKKKSPLLGK